MAKPARLTYLRRLRFKFVMLIIVSTQTEGEMLTVLSYYWHPLSLSDEAVVKDSIVPEL